MTQAKTKNPIRINKVQSGFEISFPIELLESFKATFKSAKWDKYNRVWKVGPRTGKRLEQWAEAASEAAEAIEDAKHAELTAQELTALREQFATITREAKEAQALLDTLGNVKQEIEETSTKINAESAKLKMMQLQARETLAKIIDMDEILAAQKTMAKLHDVKSSSATKDFREAQGVIDTARAALRAANLQSRGLDYLSDVNRNRPDRDPVNRASMALILDISEIENNDSSE